MRLLPTHPLSYFSALTVCLVSSSALASVPLSNHERPEHPAIYGGEAVADCGFPTTVEINGCTGTLVHPRVVITAAHCFEWGGNNTQIRFGDNYQSAARQVGATCTAHVSYDGYSAQNDIAYCVLNEAVDDVPIVPVLVGCGTGALTNGQEVAVVGFGDADDNLGDGPKRQVFTTINSVSNGEAFIGGGGEDSCQGDSGGPVYIPMADGSWRVFGITSYGGDCGQGGYYSMMHTNIGWAEQGSGFDLTPCHDANGTWNPGPECTSSPTEPHLGGGSWSGGCTGGALKALEEVCEGGTVDGSGGDDGGTGGDGGGTSDGGTSDGGTSDGGTTDGGTTDGGTSTGGSSTGGGDTGGGDTAGTGGEGSGSDTGGDEVGEVGTGDGGGFGGADDGGDEGCACDVDGEGGFGGWLALALLVPGLRRRRR